MSERLKVAGPLLAALLICIVVVIALRLSEKDVAAREAMAVESGAPSCRAGVSAHGVDQANWIDDVGAGWYVFFGGYTDEAGSSIQIAPVISVKQDKDGAKYLDSYTINPSLEGLLFLLETYPGTLWIVGNEVDRGPNPGESTSGQGDTFPDVYARAYNEVYNFIKQNDPTARVANSALVQVTPGRLQYLDLMWQSHMEQFGEPMQVDVWSMHVYVLPEAELNGKPNGIANVALGTDPALAKKGPGAHWSQCAQDDIYCFAEHDDLNIFEQQVRAMRRWMQYHGQRYKPLVLTEFSILYPCDDPAGKNCDFLRDEFGNDFDKRRVQNYLASTVARLESMTDSTTGNPLDGGRLVQQWAWFSISTTTLVGDVSDLVKSDGSSGSLVGLTDLGQQYRSMATGLSSYVNLIPALVSGVAAQTTVVSGTVDVPLRASVTNNGSIAVTRAFSVTFYSDSGLTQVIDQVHVPALDPDDPTLDGCVAGTIPFSVTWSGLAAGLHPFWVKVDSENNIAEGGPSPPGGEADNVAESFVLVNPARYWLPFVGRYSSTPGA